MHKRSGSPGYEEPLQLRVRIDGLYVIAFKATHVQSQPHDPPSLLELQSHELSNVLIAIAEARNAGDVIKLSSSLDRFLIVSSLL